MKREEARAAELARCIECSGYLWMRDPVPKFSPLSLREGDGQCEGQMAARTTRRCAQRPLCIVHLGILARLAQRMHTESGTHQPNPTGAIGTH